MHSTPLAGQLPKAAPQSKKVRSTLVSRNVTIAGHRTSVRLEPDMWNGLSDVCRRERLSLHEICTQVAQGKGADTSLTAAIRVYVMNYYRVAATEEGHFKAGHGTLMRVSALHAASPAPPQRPGLASLSGQTSSGQSMSGKSMSGQTMSGQSAQVASSPVMQSKPFMIGMSRMNGNGGVR